MATLAPIKVPIIGVDQYTKSFQKMTRSVQKMGRAITSTGKKLTASLTVPIVGIGVAGLKMSKDFNKSMANVGSLIPGQTDKLKEFKKETMALGIEFGTNVNTMADGLYQVISAIGDTTDTMSVLRISSEAATAGVSSTSDAVKLLTKVSTAYGDASAENIQTVSDLSFLAVKLGVTTFPELANSMGNIASTAQGMGVSMVELFADTAALTKVLGSTDQAATAMDAVMAALMTSSGDLDRVFKKLGVGGGNELIEKFGGLTGALEAMKTEVGGSEVALKKLFGRKEAQKAAGLLTGSLKEIASANFELMQSATGSTAEAFKAQTQGINKAGFAFDRFSEKARVAAIQIGDKLSPILLKLLGQIEPLIDKITNMSDETLMMGIKIAGAVALIGPALVIIGQLVTAGGALASVIGGSGGVGAAFALLTGPIGLAIAAIAGITAAIIYFWDELAPLRSAVLDPLMTAFSEFKDILTITSNDVGGLTDVLKSLVSFMSRLVAPIYKFGMSLALLPLRHIIRVVRIFIDVLSVVGSAFTLVSKAVKFGITWLQKLWAEYVSGTAVGKVVSSVFDSIGDAISSVVDIVKDSWQYLSGFFENIRDSLDAWGMQLDKATDKQQSFIDQKDGLVSDEGDMSLEQSVMKSIEVGQQDTAINLSVAITPEGPVSTVTDSKGRPVKLKQGAKGDVMPIGAM